MFYFLNCKTRVEETSFAFRSLNLQKVNFQDHVNIYKNVNFELQLEQFYKQSCIVSTVIRFKTGKVD